MMCLKTYYDQHIQSCCQKHRVKKVLEHISILQRFTAIENTNIYVQVQVTKATTNTRYIKYESVTL